MLYRTAIMLFAAAACLSCGRRATAKTVAAVPPPAQETAAHTARTVPFPEIPSYLSDEEAIAEYAAAHYWDGVDFADASWAESADVLEEGFARFVAVASLAPEASGTEAVRGMMRRLETHAAPEVYDMMIALADKYLYDPNSPLRNETLYIAVLEAQIADPNLEDIYKIAPRERLRMALKNRPGEPAADFSFTTAEGRHGTLYGTDAEYFLLFFHTPGCPACRQIREELIAVTAAEPLAAMLASGKLKIIALYPDADLSEWEKHRKDIPAAWINAYDGAQDIDKGELYDLRAIPSLYLLDRNKKVLLKDFTNPSLLAEVLNRPTEE